MQALGADQTADDKFSYTVSDGHGGTATATLTITVTGVNDAPVAVADETTVQPGRSGGLPSTCLANDTDPTAASQQKVLAVDTEGTLGK